MASPFRVFRKYQKTLLVVAGVVLMFVFVVGDSLMSYLSGSRNARPGDDQDSRATAVHWDGGSLTNRQVNELVFRRRIVNSFLRQVELEGRRPAYEAGVEARPLRIEPMIGPETPEQHVESSVVQTKLFADAARQAGMKVSDETIVQYLDELGRGNVPREKMRTILSAMQTNGGHVSIDYAIDALREEMLARNYLNSQQFAFETVTPQQRWKDWLRVNDRVVLEAAAIPSESFLVDVKEPSEAEIESFFDKYKDRESSPELAYGTTELPSPTPGFKVPRKIDLQFVQAGYDDFLAKAEEKVTDADIAKYYDEHKKLFEKADMGLIEDTGQKPDVKKSDAATKAGAKESANPARPAGAEEKPVAPDTMKATEPAATETKSSAAGGAATESKTAPAADKTSEEQKPAGSTEAQPPTKQEKSEATPGEEKKSSQQGSRINSVFRLAAFEENAEKKGAAADTAGETADSKAEKTLEKPAAAPAAKADTGAEKPAADNPAATTPPAASPAASKSAGPAVEAPKATGAPDATKAAPSTTAPVAIKKPVQYQPLAEVKDVIRRQLAEGKVAEQLSQLTTQIQTQLEGEFNKWFNEKLSTDGDKQEAPAPPKALTNLGPIAEKNGLKHGRTGPVSALVLRDMPLGKSSGVDSSTPLLSMLFIGHDLDLYQPVTTVDLDGNRYVVMKMSDTPARVPKLADVRDEVVRHWKKQKAAELAQKHAEELAKKAQDAKLPLTTFFADNKAVKVVRTDPFSELTGGDVGLVNGQFQPQPYRLSQPEGIVAPGPDFMARVFELKDGEVGVALNHDHSIAYVIRVVEHQPALPELRSEYLSEANTWSGLNTMTQGHVQEVVSDLRRDIIAGANLKWDRDPDKTKEQQHDEG